MVDKLVCKNAIPGTPHAKRKATRPGPYCLQCKRSVTQGRSAKTHETYVFNTYGLFPGEYAAIKAAQGGKCFICQRATGAVRRLAVDHDHALEKAGVTLRHTVRGLLCKTCNKTLGFYRDDPNAFYRAIEYLGNPPAKRVLEELE